MKKYIFTESQVKGILNSLIKEEEMGTQPKCKFDFGFDNQITNFQGLIHRDGYLYVYTENFDAWKVGPISKVPKIGPVFVEVDRRDGREIIRIGEHKGVLEFSPNCTVEQLNSKVMMSLVKQY